MPEREKRQGGGGCAIGLLLLLLVMLLSAYILSTGPFTWLADRGYMSQETAEGTAHVLYAPLRLVTKRCQPFLDFVLWWNSLFRE